MSNTNITVNSFAIRKNSSDGIGYVLSRLIGSKEIDHLDPFLLYDETKPEIDEDDDYEGGFPLHPHRGIQLLSYTFGGKLQHTDSLGNNIDTKEGDLIWNLAGKGVYHSLVPPDPTTNNNNNDDNNKNNQNIKKERLFWHIFFWINLQQKDKLLDPQFKYIPAEQIPIYTNENLKIKILTGNFNNLSSPLQITCKDSILILDITFLPNSNNNNNNNNNNNSIFKYDINSKQNAFIHIIYGNIIFNDKTMPDDHNIIILKSSNNNNSNNNNNNIIPLDQISIKQKDLNQEVRLMFCIGQRTDEPIVKFGPYVMNSQQELHQCYIDFGQQ